MDHGFSSLNQGFEVLGGKKAFWYFRPIKLSLAPL